nr:uncharacterized protein LOC109162426 [Ipomoea trifida]
MVDTMVEFAEVMAEIGNTRTGGGIIKKTFENIAGMINVVSCSQPAPQEGLLDDDDIFNQQSFLDVVSSLEQAFMQTTKNYPAQPTQPTTSQSLQQIETPTFDLRLSSPQPAPTIDVPTATERQQDQSITIELQNITRDLQEDSEKTISNGEQLDTTITDNIQKELFDSEEQFEYDGYYLSRDNFQSMRAEELESIFIDIWCLRLNHLDLNRGVDKPKRICFSTQDFAKDDDSGHSTNQQDFGQCLDTEINNVANLDISNAQLHNHFFIMCFNFTMSMLEIFDNRPLPKGLKIQQKYGDSPKVLVLIIMVLLIHS